MMFGLIFIIPRPSVRLVHPIKSQDPKISYLKRAAVQLALRRIIHTIALYDVYQRESEGMGQQELRCYPRNS